MIFAFKMEENFNMKLTPIPGRNINSVLKKIIKNCMKALNNYQNTGNWDDKVPDCRKKFT